MRQKSGKNLQDYRGEIARCVRCGACTTVCPSFLADRRESRSPRGRIALIEAVLDGRLPLSQVYRDRLATCTTCMACQERCASNVPIAEIVSAAKVQAVREEGTGLVATVISASLRSPVLMRSLAWLAPVALHYAGADMRGRAREGWARGARPQEGRTKGAKETIVFFPGCAVRYFQRDIEGAVVAVLGRLGYEVIVPEGLECCGRPFLSLGDRRSAEEVVRRNSMLFAASGAKAVVTACASCGLTFKNEYPTLLAPAGVEAPAVVDIHEFLADKLGSLDLGPVPGRITVHDPCHLGRGQGLADAVRSVLDAVPGLDRAEMQEPSRCCGFGGVMRATHPELSQSIGRAKARDIIGTGAPIVATGCPGCRMQIRDALRREGSSAEVLHPVQVIAAALRGSEHGELKGDGTKTALAGSSRRARAGK